jgi:MOSC domain-containing protein YiiM
MTNQGVVLSVNISVKKGEKKTPRNSITITEKGIEGDAHAGDWHRQVSLLSQSSIDKMKGKGVEINYGDFAENITVQGIELWTLELGQRIRIGESVVLEVTQIGKECHEGCAIRQQVGDCVMPREGIFTKVISTGTVTAGDTITLI